MINIPKETVYHGRQDDVQSVHFMYVVTERDSKLKHEWKVLVGGLCTLTMLLECTNVVLSSRRENKDHPIDYEMRVPKVLPVRNDTMCEHGGHQFNLVKSNKRLTVCTYERRVLFRWRCARAQRENTKHRLLLFSYGNIICRHLQIWDLLYEHTLIIKMWII